MKRWLKILLFLFLAFYIIDVSIILAFANGRKDLQKSNVIIVFGAKPYSKAMKERTLHGLRLYEKKLADTLIFSGGKSQAKSPAESEIMHNIALNFGQSENIIIENQSLNSYQNLLFSKNHIEENQKAILVSDCYHIARLYITSLQLNYNQADWSCVNGDYYKKSELLFYYFRESIALPYYIFKYFI